MPAINHFSTRSQKRIEKTSLPLITKVTFKVMVAIDSSLNILLLSFSLRVRRNTNAMCVLASSLSLPTWSDICWFTLVCALSSATSASRPLFRNRRLKHTWLSTCLWNLLSARWVRRNLPYQYKSVFLPDIAEHREPLTVTELVSVGVWEVLQQNVQPAGSHAPSCR